MGTDGFDHERGAISASYVAVVGVVASVIAAVLAIALPEEVAAEGEEAVCSLFDGHGSDCVVDRPGPGPEPDPMPPFDPGPGPGPAPVPDPGPIPEPEPDPGPPPLSEPEPAPPHLVEGWPELDWRRLPDERAAAWHGSISEVETDLGLDECEQAGVSATHEVQVEVDIEPNPDGTFTLHEIRIHNPGDFAVGIDHFEIVGDPTWGMVHHDPENPTEVPAGGSNVVAPHLLPGQIAADEVSGFLAWRFSLTAISETVGDQPVAIPMCSTRHAGGWWS